MALTPLSVAVQEISGRNGGLKDEDMKPLRPPISITLHAGLWRTVKQDLLSLPVWCRPYTMQSRALMCGQCMQEYKLYIRGSSSEVTDIHNPDTSKCPLYQQADHLDFTLKPGEALYMPALWPHSVLSEDFSISVNVFWRDLPPSAYPRKDLYGNRDPVAAEAALAHAEEAAAELEKLPGHFRAFYGRRCLRQLKKTVAREENM